MLEVALLAVGSMLGYWFARLQGWQDRKRRGKVLAAGLLAELRTLEYSMRRIYAEERIGAMRGSVPMALFANLGDAVLSLFDAETAVKLLRFQGLLTVVDNLWRALECVPVDHLTEHHHWKLRAAAGHAARRVEEVKEVLTAAGGKLPGGGPIERVTFPNLPPLPDPSFPMEITRLDQAEDVEEECGG